MDSYINYNPKDENNDNFIDSCENCECRENFDNELVHTKDGMLLCTDCFFEREWLKNPHRKEI